MKILIKKMNKKNSNIIFTLSILSEPFYKILSSIFSKDNSIRETILCS